MTTKTDNTPSSFDFDLKKAANDVRSLILQDVDERKKFTHQSQKRSKRISVAMSDFHQEISKDKSTQVAILTELYEKKLINAKSPEKAKQLFEAMNRPGIAGGSNF